MASAGKAAAFVADAAGARDRPAVPSRSPAAGGGWVLAVLSLVAWRAGGRADERQTDARLPSISHAGFALVGGIACGEADPGVGECGELPPSGACYRSLWSWLSSRVEATATLGASKLPRAWRRALVAIAADLVLRPGGRALDGAFVAKFAVDHAAVEYGSYAIGVIVRLLCRRLPVLRIMVKRTLARTGRTANRTGAGAVHVGHLAIAVPAGVHPARRRLARRLLDATDTVTNCQTHAFSGGGEGLRRSASGSPAASPNAASPPSPPPEKRQGLAGVLGDGVGGVEEPAGPDADEQGEGGGTGDGERRRERHPLPLRRHRRPVRATR